MKDYFFAPILIVLLLGAVGVMYALPALTQNRQAPPVSQSVSIKLSIEGLYIDKSLDIFQDQTVLDILKQVNRTDPKMSLITKDYAGMGTLVVGIHGISNGTDSKYWQYKVNGVMPQIGADQYKPKNGDSIEWFFGTSEQ